MLTNILIIVICSIGAWYFAGRVAHDSIMRRAALNVQVAREAGFTAQPEAGAFRFFRTMWLVTAYAMLMSAFATYKLIQNGMFWPRALWEYDWFGSTDTMLGLGLASVYALTWAHYGLVYACFKVMNRAEPRVDWALPKLDYGPTPPHTVLSSPNKKPHLRRVK